MPLGWRIGFGGIAMVAAVLALGGCGGGSGGMTGQERPLGTPICDVYGREGALIGLEAGIAATEREFRAPAQGPKTIHNDHQILRAMKENIGLIRGRLKKLEDCARNAFPVAEGKPVHEASPPRRARARRTVFGHRLGPARVEPGEQILPASPCGTFGKNGATKIHIFPEAAHCARVGPAERLLFVNDTGIGPQHEEAAAIRILVGNYELWIGPHENGLIRTPVETYLGRGSHRVRVAGAPGSTVLLLPPVCAMRPPVAPGEELCFR